MRLTTDKQSLLRALLAERVCSVEHPSFRTGLDALDELAPGGAFQYGAVHELLNDPRSPSPKTIALLLAQAAQQQRSGHGDGGGGAVVWSDPQHDLYPPALLSVSTDASVDLRRLILLRCENPADELWALAECLRCKGVSATVASISRLTQLEARRLQLAAECGGGIGLFMRPYAEKSHAPYAAATRWRVRPASGTADIQRWSVELLHGHGLRPAQSSRGKIGQVVLIEVNRETRALRASASTAHRQAPPQTTCATA
jgi:protein ImuA